jgi:hypothetical protein
VQLAIAVVYLVRDEGGPLLRLHLDRLRRHTDVPYTIYAGMDLLAPRFAEVLKCEPNVRPLFLGESPYPGQGTAENSYYLTLLTDRAFADGATHVAHLHVDSFPIRDGWAGELAASLGPEQVLAGVAATEVGERDRPRSFGLFVPREFCEQWGPVPSVTDMPADHADYREYRRRFVGLDSGDPYGYVLWTRALGWRRLERSNAREDHYLLGGVYGDTFFHLGAAARTVRRFPPNHPTDEQVARRRLVRRTGRALLPRGLRTYVPSWVRRLWNPDGSDPAANDRAFAAVRDRLLSDPEGYISYLRGLT